MVMEKKFYINNLKQLDELAGKIVDNIKYPSVFLLSGDLGSGKTAFTKALAKHLGVNKHVTSPTFLIHKSYDFNGKTLHHYDLYRLFEYEQLREIGFEEKNGQYILVIEWPEQINDLEAKIKKMKNIKSIIKINFYHTDYKNKRKLIIKYE